MFEETMLPLKNRDGTERENGKIAFALSTRVYFA